jgi:hypothetical protein
VYPRPPCSLSAPSSSLTNCMIIEGLYRWVPVGKRGFFVVSLCKPGLAERRGVFSNASSEVMVSGIWGSRHQIIQWVPFSLSGRSGSSGTRRRDNIKRGEYVIFWHTDIINAHCQNYVTGSNCKAILFPSMYGAETGTDNEQLSRPPFTALRPRQTTQHNSY